MTEDDGGSIYLKDSLATEPSSASSAVLQRDSIIPLKVEFKVTARLVQTSPRGALSPGNIIAEGSFYLKICSGIPVAIVPTNLPDYCSNNKLLPTPLKFHCEDKWGHLTVARNESHSRSPRWKIVFDPSGPLKSSPVDVRNNGHIVVKDVFVNATSNPNGDKIYQTIYLDVLGSSDDDEDEEITPEYIRMLKSKEAVSCEFSITIVPSSRPTTVSVSYLEP
jgi:hypothetical protein